jgi:hypothetical protein
MITELILEKYCCIVLGNMAENGWFLSSDNTIPSKILYIVWKENYAKLTDV